MLVYEILFPIGNFEQHTPTIITLPTLKDSVFYVTTLSRGLLAAQVVF